MRLPIIILALVFCSSLKSQPLLLSIEELQDLPEFTLIEDAMSKAEIVYMLNLRDKGIITLPDNIAELYNLQILDLSYNDEIDIEQVVRVISSIKSLQVLILDGTQLKNLPKKLSGLKNLKVLGLDNNPDINLAQVFNTVSKLTKLKYLFLAKNHITDIPAEVSKLNNLEYLYLNENELTDLPDEINVLTNLELINLNGNQIPKAKTEELQTELPNATVME